MAKNKKFDVIVWGASGFTGRLVAEYLNQRYGADGGLSWAMAGRSAEKLKQVAEEIGAGSQPIILADAADPSSLGDMVEQTRVVCTTVGPYQKYGTALVAACVEAGTDYVDLSGEPAWMRKMIDRYGGRAKETGARIVHSCGFDSIPFDLGVFFLQNEAQREFGAPCTEVKARVKSMKGNVSGGTVASLSATIDAGKKDKFVRTVMADPYALAPDDTAERPRQPTGRRSYFDKDANSWVAPFVMADINLRNIHRSNKLLGYAYGPAFLYSEMMMAPNAVAANAIAGGLAAFMGALMIPPSRFALEKFVLPSPGEGPNKRQREEGYFDVRFFGRTQSGDTVGAKVTGDRDPGYGSTSKMIAEAAACLALDADKGKPGGGFWTPASAMGTVLIERLQENAGLTFERLA